MPQEDINVEETKEIEINLDKRYSFPSPLVIKEHNDSYLVIYTGGISWIVLNSKTEVDVFHAFLNGASINEVLETNDEEIVLSVIRQIEARRFDDPHISKHHERNMYLILTNRCNQRCRHCYMFAGEKEYPELSILQWKKILSEFRKQGGTGVTFTGGEVTVFKGYSDLLKHAHNIGLSVTVLSNGTQWTKRAIDELHSFIDEIQVSIDGYDDSSYFRVRQHDGFKRALECIHLFYETNTKVSMAVTPLFDNLDAFLDNFESFARAFQTLYPNVFIKFNYELITGRDVSLSQEENNEYKKKIKNLVRHLYPNYHAEMFVLNYESRARRKNCGFGDICIAPNGDVFWCNRIFETDHALNAARDNFETIMLSAEEVKRKTSVDNTYPCRECDIRYICGGGCRLEYENIDKVKEYSDIWKYKCPGKDDIYNKMILTNEYFFEV